MAQLIFTIYDAKAESYSQPFFQPTRAAAVRVFSEEVTREGSFLNKYPEDYTLYEIGTWDQETGEVSPFTPLKVVAAIALVPESSLT